VGHGGAQPKVDELLEGAYVPRGVDDVWADDELVRGVVEEAVGVGSNDALGPLPHPKVGVDLVQTRAGAATSLVADVGHDP
jgi:hypothetical protein